MGDTTSSSIPVRKRRGWLRFLLWAGGALILLVVVLYFVATSSAFFKGVILPQVSQALGARVTVESASISPFSQVILKNLKVQAAGAQPVLTAAEVRARYRLTAILRGNLKVDEVALISPTVSLLEQPDGSRNIDAILKAISKAPAKKPAAPPEKKPSSPPQVSIAKVIISGATLESIKNYPDNHRDVARVSNLNLEIDGIQNGQTARMTVGADVNVDNNPPAPGTNGQLQASLKGNFAVALAKDLSPASINGQLGLTVTKAAGAMADCSDLALDLNSDVTPAEIKQFAVRVARRGATFGEVRVSGPFSLEKTEGRLNLTVGPIDKQILNLVGAKNGIDFGATTISSSNVIEVANAGSAVTIAGQFDVNQLQLRRADQTTPVLDLRARYDLAVNSAAKNALLQKLDLVGTQNQRPFLAANLTSPMNVNWGGAGSEMGNSALNILVTNFNLGDWKTFTGHAIPSGLVNANVNLVSQAGGQQLVFGADSRIEDLTVVAGSNQISQVAMTLHANGEAGRFQQFNLKNYDLQIARARQPLVSVSGSANYDTVSGNADAHVVLKGRLPALVAALPVPDVTASSGTVDLQADVTQRQKAQTITGQLALADLTGRFGKSELQGFGLNANLDVASDGQVLEVRKFDGGIVQAGRAGGSFAVSAKYELAKKSGALTAKLTDFNQDGLRPFLEPLLAGKKLASVAINGNTSAQYDPQGGSAVKADLQVTNLVVKDPANKFPATPLEARLTVDASLEKQIADVRQFRLALTPTARAKNELNFSGRVDLSQTNAITGNLKLAADSLDVTRYYDLFAGGAKPTAAPPAAPPKGAGAPPQEPAPVQLPLKNFVVDATVGQFYLREIEIKALQTSVRIDGGQIVVHPCQFTLNGAPVKADANLDLGVPGWKYRVAASASRVPVKPLANSFLPEEKDQYNGLVSAEVNVDGAGITGANLKKNLNGNVSLTLSNANIQLVKSKTKVFFIPINLNLIATLLNVPEIMDSPLTGAKVRMKLGQGQIDAQQAEVISPAFLANVHGNILLADNLNDSTLNLPVEVSLTNKLASKLTVAGGPPAGAAGYTQLPVFLTVGGTLGKPEYKKNVVVLAALTAGAAGGLIGGRAGEAVKAGSGIVQGLEGLLGGRKTSEPAGQTNSSTATNKPAGGIFNLFKR